VSTDSQQIINVCEQYGLHVPFVRPAHLATDTANSNDVLLHALHFYRQQGKDYRKLLLLQPTSPLRTVEEVKEALSLYRDDLDMVVSVTKSHASAVLCCDDETGYLQSVFNKKGVGRQLVPTYYEYNGAIYVMNVSSLEHKGMAHFTKRLKYVMPKAHSIDIDDIYDFLLIETIMSQKND
jgi:N-acylneuraminate cytidylyltransferase